MGFYTKAQTERLKAQVMAIALNHGIRSSRSYIERIAHLKSIELKQNEKEILQQLCEALGVDYDELEPIKEEEK